MRKIAKKILYILLFTLIIFISLNNYNNLNVKASEIYEGQLLDVKIDENREFRGIWVSPLVSDIPRFSSISQYQSAITKVLDNMEKYNFNTIVFHIRIYNDALYESKYCDWSTYCNTRGSWDPLPWVIDECHKRGIEFHAWMNPYRVATAASSTIEKAASKFSGKNVASNPGNLLKGNTYIILNPGLPNVQQFLHDVVMEVVQKYDVDAIHFDDYFYDGGINDTLTYQMYGKDYPTNTDFRRGSISKLIESLHNSITKHNKEKNKAVKLGISPTQIYRCGDGRVTYDDEGHAITNGVAMDTGFDQHYNSACADTLLWIQKGWIDYIVPQLYQDGNQFTTISTWWDQVVRFEKALFVAGITSASCDWNHMENLDNCSGICLFSYKALNSLMQNQGAKNHLKDKALPHINFTNEFDESDFEAVTVKIDGGYKLAISKHNDKINWYTVSNNIDDTKYQNLTDMSKTLTDLRGENSDLSYTITPFMANGTIGTPKTVSVSSNYIEINFYDEEDVLIKSDYLKSGDSITYPELKYSEDFNYSWDKNIDKASENVDIKMIKSEKTYKYTYVDPDGNIITTQEYKLGDKVSLPELPESKKYNYTKWSINDQQTVRKDTTVTLVYKLIDYKLKVYGNGELLLDETVHYGDDLNQILSEIKDYNLLQGQTFKGFDNTSETVTGDMTINALYEEEVIEFTVTYKDGDKILKTEKYNLGDNVTLDKSLTKDGYTFDSFTLNGEVITNITNIQEDLIIQCIFTKNNDTLSGDNGCKSSTIIFELNFLLLALFIIKRRKY